jgi:hypothetical protein
MRPDATIFEDCEDALARSAGAECVRNIRETIFMESAGRQRPKGEDQGSGNGSIYELTGSHEKQCAGIADRSAYDREESDAPPGRRRPAPNGRGREKLNRAEKAADHLIRIGTPNIIQ